MVHVDAVTSALRGMVVFVGVRAEEYVPHPVRIGDATYLSAGGAKPALLQREGRWESGASGTYVQIKAAWRNIYPSWVGTRRRA